MKISVNRSIKRSLLTAVLASVVLLLNGCINSQGPSVKRTRIKDFSIVNDFSGCEDAYLVYDGEGGSECTDQCSEGTHLASLEELAAAKQELVASGDETLLGYINNSKNICIADAVTENRPTMQIDVKNDFCSCVNGKSDIINDCDAICASKPMTSQPTLYVNTIMGAEIYLNDKLKNLHNWCTVQLASDDKAPQCTLSATDGSSTINIPVNTSPGSNSFTADLKLLAYDRTYIVKIMEFQTGSNAQSKEFQIRRKKQSTTDSSGALKVSNISQYSCMSYGGVVNSTGIVKRVADTFSKYYYYFPANETPAPMPPVVGGNESLLVCHDEQKFPGNDSIEYPRLEHIPMAFTLWDKADSRFAKRAEYGGNMGIRKIIEDRLASEYPNSGITGADLFRALPYANRPPTTSTSSTASQTIQGFIMVPFTDGLTQKSYCPSAAQLSEGSLPLLNILHDYVADTEGLFLSEKEGEVVYDNGTYKTIYGTMFVPENVVRNYGFYIENGLKIKVTDSAMSTKTIHFYWPLSSGDPLTAGGRKLFTVRSWDTLAGGTSSTPPTSEQTTDKRIGCIPKSK